MNTVQYKSKHIKPLGQHFLGELEVRNRDLLNNQDKLKSIVKRTINQGGLHLVHLHSHRFFPVGITVIAIISESHLAIHTYPESGHVSVDIYTCSANPQTNERMWRVITDTFQPYRSHVLHIERGEKLLVKRQESFLSQYHVRRHLLHRSSLYQTIDIIENEEFGRMLFLDGDLQISERDAGMYNRALVGPLRKAKPRRVLILGGGDGGVLYELLKLQPEKVVVVDIDRAVITAAQKYLQAVCHHAFADRRVRIVIGDVTKFLSTPQKVDAVIYDLTAFPESLVGLQRRTFLTNLLRHMRRILVPGGMLTLQCGSALNKRQLRLTKKYLRKYFPGVSFSEVSIPSYGEPWVFAIAVKSGT